MYASQAGSFRFHIPLLALVFVSFLWAILNDRQIETGHAGEKDASAAIHFDQPFQAAYMNSPNISELRSRDDYSCSKDEPCKTNACCGGFFGGTKGTCGFGPNFCGDDCVSNCKATSECGAHADPPGKTCPLNVCCSEFGFCGTTSEFCGKGCQSNCGEVKVPDGKAEGGVSNKVVGYYEAWSARWKCQTFPPSAIPVDGLTHINFAFAGIDPDSFKVTTMDAQTPESLFMEVADVRTLNSGKGDLKVFASIGGWSFSDNDTKTQPVFGNIARSETNRQEFANNVVSFMRQYGFDGVDIDWEYPGASDRGGKKDDTGNFVALMKTMKDTFEREGKDKYGLTFTIPTSYWYLRWYDLPGMLKYADWVNLMSYDLHGAWDKNNPIGNVVQGHTNLTEIKMALELLWRVQVQPKQVVLGFGFYGRAFQLEKADCSTVGCTFKEAATPGPCTNGPGTLGYFEIQEIIKDQNPEIIHDKDAAVNYFTFQHRDKRAKRSGIDAHVSQRDSSNDQWVSYDDEKTIKQKVDWANDLGLGGSMIWSVDQDDDNFSALSGLVGRPINKYTGGGPPNTQVADTGHWASMNGQKCKLTDCNKGEALTCEPGWGMPPGGQSIKDNCGGAGERLVCCPVDSMPSNCQWRGGESGAACHGQCHQGETTLFHSQHATVNCFKPGMQAFCCEATSFTALIDACKWTECKYPQYKVPNKDPEKTRCGADTVKVATKFASTVCELGKAISTNDDKFIDLCCPKASAFQNCHWVGKGSCDDNECAATDVQIDRDPFGDGNRCSWQFDTDRQKSLCCNTPKNLNPFLPVSLDKIFPSKPPEEDFPKYDLSILGKGSLGEQAGNDANSRAFGFLVVDGPSEAVQSLRKRDGSDWHIVSCDSMGEQGADLQIVCLNDEAHSNCRGIYENGVEGTVVAMPNGCGPGSYAVVHSIQPSLSQTLPPHVKRAAPPQAIVYDIKLSYDFSLVKKDAGDIFIRVDYSNMANYWERVVKADPNTTPRRMDKRFWSGEASVWKAKMDDLRSNELATPSMETKDLSTLLLGAGRNDKCGGDDDDGFLNVKVRGDIALKVRFGLTLVGTLSPHFHLEEAYTFFDSSVSHDGTLDLDGRGKVQLEGEAYKQKSILPTPMTAYGFSHPGIVSLGPQLDVFASLMGTGDIDGKFSVDFKAGNGNNYITLAQPTSLGVMSGGPDQRRPSNAFHGDLAGDKPSQTSKRSSSGGTLFAMALFYKTMMNIDIFDYGTKQENAKVQLSHFVDSYVRLESHDNGNILVTASNQEAGYEINKRGDIPGWEETDAILLGDKGIVWSLYEDHRAPAKRNAPKVDGIPIFNSSDVIHCTGTGELKCPSMTQMSDLNPDLNGDDSRFDNDSDLDGAPRLVDRQTGNPRGFRVRGPTREWRIFSDSYPNQGNGENLRRLNPRVPTFGEADPDDCLNGDVTDDYNAPGATVVTEHILELNYFARVLEWFMHGEATLPDGTVVRTQLNTVDEGVLDDRSPFSQEYHTWDPQLGNEHPGSPEQRIWQLFGSETNYFNLVNTESNLNSIKAFVWRGQRPVSDDTWTRQQWDRAGSSPADIRRGEAALGYLNNVMMVISYLNHHTVNEHLGDSLTDMMHELVLFSDRYNALHGTDIDLGSLHREYVHRVLIPRIEGVDAWIERQLHRLRSVWAPELANSPNDPGIIRINSVIRDNLERVLHLQIDRHRLP